MDDEGIDVPVIDRKTGEEVALPGPSVMDWATGQQVELSTATTDRLGEVIEHGRAVQVSLRQVEQEVSDELVARLDRNADWTWHGDGGLKISTSSPDRGTEDFPIDALEACLTELVEKNTISAEGAAKAIKRQITLTIDVPLGVAMKPILDKIERADVNFDFEGHSLPVVKASGDAAKIAGGIAKLRKIPDAAKALKKAATKKDAPLRRVKVERA